MENFIFVQWRVKDTTILHFTLGFSESSLSKKCPYSELLWAVYSPNAEKYGPE